jgi:tripartite ATP-independent transporter DctM subunit
MSVWGARRPGGLAAMTTVVAIIMAAMTGVVGGEIMLLGMIALPQLLRMGYDEKLALGTIGAGGALGSMIPPSINLIIYGLTANVSVGDLFTAAFVPGFLMAVSFIVYILVRCGLNPAMGPPPTDERRNMPLRDKLALLRRIVMPLLIGAGVLGSIYLGVAAVTEAAALGAAAMILVAWLRGELSWPMLAHVSMQTIRTSGIVLWLVFGAVALIGVYNLLGGTSFVKDLFLGSTLPPWAIVAVMLGLWVFLGAFMEGTAICLLTVPIFAPVVTGLGYDLVWFGVLFAITCQIGYLTPPFGTAAFYMKSVTPPHITLETIFNAFWPFTFLQCLILVLVWVFPILASH